MCAQRTYRRAAGGNRKAEVNANMGFLQRIMHHVKAKNMLKRNPEFLQNSALHDPKPSKIEARGIPGRKNAFKKRPNPAKKRPRAPNNCPRGTQEATKRGQEPAQSSRKAATWHPRATLERFGALQNPARRAPRRGWSRIFVGSFVRHAREAILYRFSICATSLRYVKT